LEAKSQYLDATDKSFSLTGVLSVLVGHPLDLVKVRMQTTRNKEGKQQRTFQSLGQIVRTEGVGGIYKGVGAPILAVAPIWATSFWGFDTGIKLVRALFHLSPQSTLSLPQLCIAGAFSALPTALIMVPSERIKCILQMQQAGNEKKYNGMMDCARQIYREGGIRGLYKGTAFTLMRDIPANTVYFGVYELVKQGLMTTSKAGLAGGPSTLTALTAGAAAGIAFWPVALPTDTLKSRYQTAQDGHYNNIADVYNEVVKEDGIGGLFNGIGPAMIRSAPANAFSFLGAEATKKILSAFLA
jgi:solute carrier family 25 carnitine/acylcarnitine transporter 20/29